MIAVADGGGLWLVAGMALATLLVRFGGVFIMSLFPLGPRGEGFINAMAGSVLVAVLVPIALEGDPGGRLALLTTAGVMLVWKRPMPAIALGVLVAALVRSL